MISGRWDFLFCNFFGFAVVQSYKKEKTGRLIVPQSLSVHVIGALSAAL
jgi:hypothetical protein